MAHDCERQSGPQWSTKGDPRVTRLGRLLRRTYVDELPQLWNVLRGDMCLIGPRPERPEFVTRLESQIPHYRARMLVRPGLSGLAQVQLPPDSDLDSVRLKLVYDLYYVRHAGPWLDLRLMAATVFHLLRIPFATSRLLLSVPSGESVERPYLDWLGLGRGQTDAKPAPSARLDISPDFSRMDDAALEALAAEAVHHPAALELVLRRDRPSGRVLQTVGACSATA